ncbi:hypothetical protein GOV05_00465 [Candidatus Woesearchaeota archaeon]|nr:hypothetical protein [Candidatus Woesearchaeota archaeon]
MSEVKRAIKEITKDSAARRKASKNEMEAFQEIYKKTQEAFKKVQRAISNHQEADFTQANPQATLSSITSELSETIEIWNDIKKLRRAEGKILRDLGDYASSVWTRLAHLKEDILKSHYKNKKQLLHDFNSLVQNIDNNFKIRINNELRIDQYNLAA